jgi:malonyl-CoA O-methyltransferase
MSLNKSSAFIKSKIADQFNRAAHRYDKAAFLQQEIGVRLIERLDDILLKPEKIIDLGCGTGKSLTQLAQRYPHAEIYGVDIAPQMLTVGARRAVPADNVKYICAEATQLPFADNSVDLVFSNLMFQWCDPLHTVLQESYRVLRDGGLLFFTYFGPDTLQELRYCWAQIDNYPHVNDFIDMHHVGDWLMQTHFNDPVMDMEYMTVTYKKVLSLMRDLKHIGATNQNPLRRKTLLGKNKLALLEKHYQQFRLEDDTLPATYEVVYGHAWKLPRKVSTNESYVPVEAITTKKR